MADAPVEGSGLAAQPMLEVAADDRIRVVSLDETRPHQGGLADVVTVQLPGSSDTAASFQLEGEDHTLGNALRYIIMKK
jgi:hypothetical protein